ncbi:hypothetical protein Pmani_028195 [Petrolisthes manimaculis]|uniref:Uncharacterized protein n=1 Tax=Petrolisthes manimaculis TaxID=1843537 RepID=A0AAE1NZX4_9EUCA|nr:hypothetical protein Pmani_028195 [Petrolisthes manimaculis]
MLVGADRWRREAVGGMIRFVAEAEWKTERGAVWRKMRRKGISFRKEEMKEEYRGTINGGEVRAGGREGQVEVKTKCEEKEVVSAGEASKKMEL